MEINNIVPIKKMANRLQLKEIKKREILSSVLNSFIFYLILLNLIIIGVTISPDTGIVTLFTIVMFLLGFLGGFNKFLYFKTTY